jgi:D-3-phosphoglycerate dehydrogenase
VQDHVEGVRQVDLDTLLAESDVVSLHARATRETIGMISVERLAAMKDGAYLINSARGSLVDEQAVVQALKSGKLRGAALDSFAGEPLDNEELRALPNVTLTPHIAGASRYVCTYAATALAEDLDRFLAGKELKNPST